MFSISDHCRNITLHSFQGKAIFQVLAKEFFEEFGYVEFDEPFLLNSLTCRMLHALKTDACGYGKMREKQKLFNRCKCPKAETNVVRISLLHLTDLERVGMQKPNLKHILFENRPYKYRGLESAADAFERISDNETLFASSAEGKITGHRYALIS